MIAIRPALAALAVALAPAILVAAPPPLAAPAGEVTAVSLRSTPGTADFVVSVRGDVQVTDFLLAGPDRLVLDLTGARVGAGAQAAYDGVARGGIRNVRVGQFKPDVVRIVLDLEAARPYKLVRTAEQVRISFGTDQVFRDWSAGVAVAAVASAAPAPHAARAPEVALPEEPAARRADQREEPRLNVTWEKADISDVIAGFGALSGRTIVLGSKVTGTVTAEIRDKPWPLAFQAVLASQGLMAQEMPGGIIRVDVPSAFAQADSTEPLETRAVRVNYNSPVSLTRTVESILTKGKGRVIADTASNSVVITDVRSRIGDIANFIRSIDIRRPQVSIQAKIIFVDRTDLEQLGVKYDLGSRTQFFNSLVQRTDPTTGQPYQAGVNVINLGGNTLSAIGNAQSSVPGSALDLIFSTAVGNFSLTSFLSAVETYNLADVQAEPTITTVANRPASILVGEETPIRVVDLASGTAGAAAKSTVSFRETGIKLNVTPTVTSDRQIVMDIVTERSSVQAVAQADIGFNFAKQNASTRLIVNDGETAVIGGLTVTDVTKSRTGIPLLSGLPIIGKLFSTSLDQERRRDLVILVTPRITDDGSSGAP